MIYAFAAICLFGGAVAQGQTQICPNVSRMGNFDRTRFMGTWYVAKIAEPNVDSYCMSVDYTVEDGVDYGYVKWRTTGVFGVTTRKERLQVGSIEELILGTDYTSYAISYLCDSMGPTAISIITKARHPTQEVLMLARYVLEQKLGNVELYDVNQSNCY